MCGWPSTEWHLKQPCTAARRCPWVTRSPRKLSRPNSAPPLVSDATGLAGLACSASQSSKSAGSSTTTSPTICECQVPQYSVQ